MRIITTLAVGLALLCTSTAALAKKHHTGTTRAHHCQLKGATVQKSKKMCIEAGGTWEKGDPAAAKSATGAASDIK